jgi:hypothetical protein
MALFSEFRPVLSEIARYLRLLSNNVCKTLSPTAGTSGSITTGYTCIKIIKTNGIGTVTITLPDTTVYSLTSLGDDFSVCGGTLGAFSISSGDGGTWQWYAY